MANGTIAASQLEMLSQSGTGIITITPPATNTNRAITLPDAAGAIVVSGTTPSLNGITFPATQSASADANTLDDYEEGTWTPVLTAATTDPTYTLTINQSFYTVIGRVCIFQTWIRANITDAGSGSARISLPFLHPVNRHCAVTVAHQTISASDVENGYIPTNSSNVFLTLEDSTTAATFKTGAACDVMISGSYTIA